MQLYFQEGSAGWSYGVMCLQAQASLDEVAEKEVMFNNDEQVGDSAYTYHIQDFDNMSKDLSTIQTI